MEGMEPLIYNFCAIIDEFRLKKHDLLDYHNNKFDRDYVEFNVRIRSAAVLLCCAVCALLCCMCCALLLCCAHPLLVAYLIVDLIADCPPLPPCATPHHTPPLQ